MEFAAGNLIVKAYPGAMSVSATVVVVAILSVLDLQALSWHYQLPQVGTSEWGHMRQLAYSTLI